MRDSIFVNGKSTHSNNKWALCINVMHFLVRIVSVFSSNTLVTNLDAKTSLVFYNLNSSLAKTQGSLYVHTGKRLIRYSFIKQQVEIT